MLLPAQVIQKKRDGQALTEAEIRFFVLGFTRVEIPDYQMAALAMAICFQGMNFDETMWLTRAMVDSGQIVQWRSGAPGGRALPFYADKHSTGGIGDKVSLILAPLVAACGVKVPMLSGRGLGPTGGTLDKLESIPGFRTNLSLEAFRRVTDEVGCVITGTTPEIAPADKKLYALRDVTATVSCLPLIVASIMSKKLAENVDGLVLDVKWGSGAFMKTREASRELARAMVEVGQRYGKKVVALQTDMNQPLGQCIGNALEVRECLDVLRGEAKPADLLEVTLALAAEMLVMAGAGNNVAAAREMLQKKLASGEALKKFHEMVAAQGGTGGQLPIARHTQPVVSVGAGYVHSIACDQIGYAVIALGGGRAVANDTIDCAVGFEQPKKIGDRVEVGEPLLVMHYNDAARATEADRMAREAYIVGDEPVEKAGVGDGANRMMPKVKESELFIESKLGSFKPEVALIAGSGLGGLTAAIADPIKIAYADIPHFPKPTVAGHAGEMVFGMLAGKKVMMLSGRFHMYEGRTVEEVVYPVHVVDSLGVKILVVTNAAGGINPEFNPGDLMLIQDHINFMGVNPLINMENGGPRFLDMSVAYSTRLREKIDNAAERAQIPMRRGVYLGTTGPSYETPAEVKAFAWQGADAVGMSTVPEVILARHHNIEVAGISCITNLAAGISAKRLSHDEVLAVGRASQDKLVKLLTEFLSTL